MNRRALFLLCLFALPISGRCLSQEGPIVPGGTHGNQLTIHEDVSDGSALSALIRIGIDNKIPLGLVITDPSLCTDPLHLDAGSYIPAALVENLNNQLNNYQAEWTGSVLYVHPRITPSENAAVLHTTIPHFFDQADTHQGMGMQLWAAFITLLHPKGGYLTDKFGATNPDLIPAMTIENGTVDSILNQIVVKGKKGMWVMYQVPQNWKEKIPTPWPIKVLSYQDDRSSAESLSCKQ